MTTQQKIKISIQILSCIVLLVGVSNLFGWYFDLPILTELVPGLTPMMYNTGLCFAVTGIALLLSTFNFPWCIRCISIFPILVGGLTLLDYFFGLNINIDNFFFKAPQNSLVFFQGRMAPNTALCFILAGLSLIFLVTNRESIRNWIASCAAAIVFSLGVASLIGYVFQLAGDTTIGLNISRAETLMAVNTSWNFVLLGIGIYLISFSYTREGKIATWAIVPMALSALSIQINIWHMTLLKNKMLQELGIIYNWDLIFLIALLCVVTFITIYLISRYIKITLLLENAKLLFQASSESRSQLLLHVSHEIKNPLNAIMGFTALLLDKKEEGDEKTTMESIQTSAAHILNLIQDLLAVSKLEGGNIELSEQEFKLHPWIDDLVKLSANRAKSKKITFTHSIDDRIPEVIVGDYSKIAQIIYNFIDNAIKFTPTGKSIDLHLTYLHLSNREFQLEIAVKDTGPGVKPEDREKIFQPFSQLRTFEKGQGSGLGLAICTTYVKMMQGKIGIKSEDKEGSTFFAKILLKKTLRQMSEQN